MKMRRFARQLLNAVRIMQEPLYSPPGHFYSPISSVADASRARTQRSELALGEGTTFARQSSSNSPPVLGRIGLISRSRGAATTR
jgi:hypothetical protein